MTKSYKIKAYDLKTNEFLKEYRTMLELAEDFDLTLESVKSYFYRYKLYGEAKIRNHNTNTWCYLEREETKKVPNYKDRCEKAIYYIMSELVDEWSIKNDGCVDGSDLPVSAITPILDILRGDNNDKDI